MPITVNDVVEWVTPSGRLSANVKRRVVEDLPGFIEGFDRSTATKTIRLPAGGAVGNASRMRAMECYCLILARKAHGAKYQAAHPCYEALAKELQFWVMREHFHTNAPKGIFCCSTCSLSILPLYRLNAFRWIDCALMQKNVLRAIKQRSSVFQANYRRAYAEWAMAYE